MELEERYTPGMATFQKETAKRYRATMADTKVWLKKQQGALDTQAGKLVELIRAQTGLQIGEKKDVEKK